MSIFVDDDDMILLTGFCKPSKQIAQLKVMGVPFRINGAGKPMVAVAAIEGVKPPVEARKKVTSPVFLNR